MNFDKQFYKSMIMNKQYSENRINSSKFMKDFMKGHARNMIQIIYPTQKARGNQVFWDEKGN